MALVRQSLGLPVRPAGPTVPAAEHLRVLDRLERQAARLRAMDAQVDAQRRSDSILKRRAGDR